MTDQDDMRNQMGEIRTSLTAAIAKQQNTITHQQEELLQIRKELRQAQRERDLFTEASAVNLEALMRCAQKKRAALAECEALRIVVAAALEWHAARTGGEASTAAGNLFAAIDTLPAAIRDSF